ncbi:recombinase family protein [Ktedonosporobacter rubrisoli]|uniref:Recombinase family protein n=1 Tax=Ktedonosporobacter rubrisoli TaxID=2509675 RepID=A0A4P6JJB3_KTERU|nr:recombinase family protein [Ktedonosporobacter rubrisoli]QBD75207.1 recombinase family protein [Ktedonosporobacter rubrisoli]
MQHATSQVRTSETSGKRVFLYCRVAVNDATSNAILDRQEAACRAYSTQHGLTVAGVFRDSCGGLRWQDMPEFTRMRKQYLEGEADDVVVIDPSRISRNTKQLFILVQEMAEHGITLFCASGGHRDASKLAVYMPEAEIVRSLFERYSR